MPQILLLLLGLTAATPLLANPCQDRFRAGLAAYARFDTLAASVEEGLFIGTGWVSVPRVLARLEDRSALTTACDEVAVHRAQVSRMSAPLQAAEREFRLASALCSGVNRDRAQDNIRAIENHYAEVADHVTFVTQLTARCAE
ncbi:hypothetical protein [Pararhodobacter sp.]|uniref:hypothetical protein n=1 Tax=Pararhodobacter sp. TaxID=2127056 RepID=UPI002AFFE7FC|nr:hypothetical protein [Pararhodobacter sp.]